MCSLCNTLLQSGVRDKVYKAGFILAVYPQNKLRGFLKLYLIIYSAKTVLNINKELQCRHLSEDFYGFFVMTVMAGHDRRAVSDDPLNYFTVNAAFFINSDKGMA